MKTPKLLKSMTGKFRNKKSGQIAATTDDIEEPRTTPKVEIKEQKETTYIVDKATETDTQLCEGINKNSEDPQPTCESKEEVQNASVDTTVREPNTPEIQPSTESCSGSGKGNSAEGKSSKRATYLIVAGVVGTILLISGVASYILNMPIVAAIVGIAGLACIGFALYNTLNPDTKLEKVEDVEQSAHYSLNPI